MAVDLAIIPDNETARMAAVRRYDVLDSPPDGAFDRITALAARICETPIAIVTIVDTDRIWFKSRHGLEVAQIDRDPGLCASAILQDQAWVVDDARADPRTLSNPLVAGDSGFGFYLGIPLTTSDGYNLGTLCILDHEARAATDRQIADLTDLAAVVMDELELRLAARHTVLLGEQLRTQAEELARMLQESLLPPSLPVLKGLDLSARYLPADAEKVGGDFYDAYPAGGAATLVVGDVCGHGAVAAALTAKARHMLRVIVDAGWSPAEALSRLNAALVTTEIDDEVRQFCTLALVRLDDTPTGKTAAVALGGHPHPLLLRADGSVQELGEIGPLVGWTSGVHFTQTRIDLVPGDALVLYTDGLTDIGRGRRHFDEASLHLVLSRLAGRGADEIAAGILSAVASLVDAPSDDIALLVARVENDVSNG